jgi:hypothetical protein
MACSDDPPELPVGTANFAGVSWVAPDKTGRLVVGWNAGQGAVRYNVYASLIEGRAAKNAPVGTTAGAIIVLAPTIANERHFITVRAVDASGLEDGNVLEKSAVAAPDTAAPQFAGPKAVAQLANAGATVSWDPATDDRSPPEAISYDVYAGRTAQSLMPIGRTGRGETSLSVAALGTPGEPFLFTVRARDVGDNVSAEAAPLAGPLGPDGVAPTFAGCGAATEIGARSLTLSWALAADDATTAGEISYEVYAAAAAGGHDFAAAPLAKAKPGASSIVLQNLEPGKRYFFVCRARDAAGNLDANKTETTVTMNTDVTPPVFAGLTDAVVDGVSRTVLLRWPAATDDTTAASALVYDVFETKTSGVYDFAAPPRVSSPPGATSLNLMNLEPRATLHWVVRARDGALNRDANLKEGSGEIKTSFAINVLPVFVKNCAVVGCHVSGSTPSGLNLAPPFTYDQIVGVTASQQPAKKRISQDPVNPLGMSYLYEKITSTMPFRGSQMPAPQTGNALTQQEKDIITSWILEGAQRN